MNLLTAKATLNAHPAMPYLSSAEDLHAGADALQTACFLLASHAGWHDGVDYTDKREVATKLALIHSEVSEALEARRKGLADTHLPDRLGIEVELADAAIRIFDLTGALNLDLASAIIRKLAYNSERSDHKRKNRAKPGGKAY